MLILQELGPLTPVTYSRRNKALAFAVSMRNEGRLSDALSNITPCGPDPSPRESNSWYYESDRCK